jgi:hypothetical protein
MGMSFVSASSQYASGSSGSGMPSGSADRTISCRYIKTETSDQLVWGTGNTAVNGQQLYLYASSSQITFGKGGSGSNLTAAINTCDGILHEVTVKTVSGVFYIYADGVLAASGTPSITYNTQSPNLVQLGGRTDGVYGDSTIYRWLAYASALTAEQIADMWYNPGRPRLSVPPVRAYYLMGEDGAIASGSDSVKDWSGYGGHLTPTNSPVYAAAPLKV